MLVAVAVSASRVLGSVTVPTALEQLGYALIGVDRLTAYLATTPGGLFAVLATAADSGSDVTYVLAVQVIRVFAMLLFAPVLARWFSRGRTRSPRGPS